MSICFLSCWIVDGFLGAKRGEERFCMFDTPADTVNTIPFVVVGSFLMGFIFVMRYN